MNGRMTDVEASSTTVVLEDASDDAEATSSQSQSSHSVASSTTTPSVTLLNGTASAETLVNGAGNYVEISLEKGDRGLGFNIVGGVDEPFIPGQPGIFVSRIRDLTPTAEDGRIKVGDRIVSVNGIELTGKTHQEAVEVFKQIPAGACHLVVEAGAENRILETPIPPATTPTTTAVEPKPTERQRSLKSILKQKQQSAAAADTETGMAAKVALQKSDGLPNGGEHISISYAPDASEENIPPASSSSLSRHSSTLSSDSPSKIVQQQRRNRSASSSSSVVTVVSTPQTSYAPTLVAEEDDEDRQSTLSLAPSVHTLVDDVPRTPKRPLSIFDPTNPTMLTEALFLSIGTVALGVGILFAYRYFKRR